jgi:hypothetical protein
MRLTTLDETSSGFWSLPLGPSGRVHELNEQLRILLLPNPHIISGLCVIHEVSEQCPHVENQKLEPRRDNIDQRNTRNIMLYPILFQPFRNSRSVIASTSHFPFARHSYFSLMFNGLYGPSRPPLFTSSYKRFRCVTKAAHYLLLASCTALYDLSS